MTGTQFQQFAAGSKITAAALTLMEPQNAVKNGVQSVANSTTLQDDNDLVFQLPGSGTYIYQTFLNYTGGVLGSSDLKCTYVYTGTSSFSVWGGIGINTSGTTAIQAGGNADGSTVAWGTSGGSFFTLLMHGTLFATSAGTLKLQWAQNTSSATNTNLRQGCHMQVWQIA